MSGCFRPSGEVARVRSLLGETDAGQGALMNEFAYFRFCLALVLLAGCGSRRTTESSSSVARCGRPRPRLKRRTRQRHAAGGPGIYRHGRRPWSGQARHRMSDARRRPEGRPQPRQAAFPAGELRSRRALFPPRGRSASARRRSLARTCRLLRPATPFRTCDRAYKQAIAIAGPTPEVLNNLGYSYLLRGDYARARAKFAEARVLDPANPYIQNNIKLLEETARKGKSVQR